jgi:hypothetical protein
MTASGLSHDPTFGLRKLLPFAPKAAAVGVVQARSGYSAPELANLLALSGWRIKFQTHTFGRSVLLAHTFFEVYRRWRAVPYLLTPLLRAATKPLALRGGVEGGALLIYAEAI